MYYFLVITPIILIIMSLIVYLVISYNDMYNFLPKIELFSKYNGSPLSSDHFKNYMEEIHKDIYLIKCPSYKTNFILDYSKNIIKVPDKYKALVDAYTNTADNLTAEFKIFKKNPWNILVSINNLEMNMPYTLGNSVIIPLKALKELNTTFIHGHINNSFLNTLIHEKIHVIQRNNQVIFDKFYITNYKFLDKKLTEPLPENLHKMTMTNPDSNNSIWIYQLENKRIIPLLTYSNNSVTEIGYNIENHNDITYLRNIKSALGFNRHTSIYHPNEIFACKVAHHIMDNNLPTNYKEFLVNL